MAQQQSWQEKFYQLAEFHLNTEALLRYALNRLLLSKGELSKAFNKECTGDVQEQMNIEARKNIGLIIDGAYGKHEDDEDEEPPKLMERVPGKGPVDIKEKIEALRRIAELRREQLRKQRIKPKAYTPIPKS